MVTQNMLRTSKLAGIFEIELKSFDLKKCLKTVEITDFTPHVRTLVTI